MNRRECLAFLAGCGAATLYPGRVLASSQDANTRFIFVLLRGGVDALSVLIPYTDPWYPVYRPTTALSKPGTRQGGINLDGTFALHPALQGLRSFWNSGKLAFVTCAGCPVEEHSHQKAQRNIETGVTETAHVKDGWLNRCAQSLATPKGKYCLITLSPSIPFIVRGRARIRVIPAGSSRYRRPETHLPKAYWALDRVYPGRDDLAVAYHQGVVDRKQRLRHIGREISSANGGAPIVQDFSGLAVRMGKEMHKNPEYRLGFLHFGGFDTHINQGGREGVLWTQLAEMEKGLLSLINTLGSLLDKTIVVVMSEFGRSAKENDLGGTENGYGGLMWVLGGPVEGGRVFGHFPGLATEFLSKGRDIPVRTDFRDIIVPILRKHMMFDDSSISAIFPHFTPSKEMEDIVRSKDGLKKEHARH